MPLSKCFFIILIKSCKLHSSMYGWCFNMATYKINNMFLSWIYWFCRTYLLQFVYLVLVYSCDKIATIQRSRTVCHLDIIHFSFRQYKHFILWRILKIFLLAYIPVSVGVFFITLTGSLLLVDKFILYSKTNEHIIKIEIVLI